MGLLDIAMTATDMAMATIPRPMPPRRALENCRIISHRGENDNIRVKENTLEAFRIARNAGVWGIECDIRWTADHVPVICHDPTPARVFGLDTAVAAMTFTELRAQLPNLPSLAEVVTEFGGNTHLLLEIKAEPWPEPQKQRTILREALQGLKPAAHYHLLSLDTAMFSHLDFAPATCFLPVAETNVQKMSAFALERGCAGLGGHYLLLGKALKEKHDAAGQRLGTGFPTSGHCLRRELNRGIEWIFTNHAVKLEGLRQRYLQSLDTGSGS